MSCNCYSSKPRSKCSSCSCKSKSVVTSCISPAGCSSLITVAGDLAVDGTLLVDTIQTNGSNTLTLPQSITPSSGTLTIDGNLNVTGSNLSNSFAAASFKSGSYAGANPFVYPFGNMLVNSDPTTYSLVLSNGITYFQISNAGTYHITYNLYLQNISGVSGVSFSTLLAVNMGGSAIISTAGGENDIVNGLKGNIFSDALVNVSSSSQFYVTGNLGGTANILAGTLIVEKLG